MIKKKLKLTKASWLILMCFAIILLGANTSQATPLSNVSIGWSNIDWHLSIDGQRGYYTNYTFYADEIGEKIAFCVENVGINDKASYELIVPINSDAANTASQFFYDSGFGYSQAATQIAIWDIVFDGADGLNVGHVRYDSNTGLYDEIQAILASYTSYSLAGPIWQAHAPAEGTCKNSQDYLVSVPDASIMWLLGTALIMLGILGRKKAKESL